MAKPARLVLGVGFVFCVALVSATAAVHDAADVGEYPVVGRGPIEMEIDLEFADDWRLANEVLFMGEDTWEPLGGTWDDEADLSGTLQIVWDPEGLYLKLIVTDEEFVAQGRDPWENDGIQIAIDGSAGELPAGLVGTTQLYNFGIADGWQTEAGDFQGEAEIMMDRDDGAGQNLFEWYMPVEIFAEKGTELAAGMEIAFAIIANDSDPGAEGQTGWIGWGSHTIVFGKNPEEMQTLVLQSEVLAVDPAGKLATAWGDLKR